MWWSMALAWAAETTDPPALPDTLPAALEQLEVLQAQLDQARATSAARVDGAEALARLEALVESGRRLIDDRLSDEARIQAASDLGDADDTRALWFLRAGAGARRPLVQEASARAALTYRGAEATAVAQRVLVDRSARRDTRSTVVALLGNHDTEDAAAVLRSVIGNRDVPARVRSDALTTLERRYPEYMAANPPERAVSDPLGGVLFVTSSGVAGGILLSSVGVWGEFEGAPTIGALGGAAIGLGTGGLIARNRPFTTAQGLAYTSGVSWGLTYGLWTTTAVHGGWRHLNRTFRDAERERAVQFGAAYRAIGVSAGTALGALALRNDPTVSDVMEINTAGYLGSAMALGATGLAFYREPDPLQIDTTYGYYRTDTAEIDEYKYQSSRWLETSSIIGATAGLATGLALRNRWDLDANDLAFAGVLGGEAAWLGLFLPAAVGIDGSRLKGSTRLPSHAAMTAGLIVSELHPIPIRRSAVTMVGAIGGNAVGGGMPLLLGNDGAQPVAISMITTGAVTTAGAFAASSKMEPDGGDWAMVTVGTLAGTMESALIGQGLVETGAFRRGFQAGGLTLVGGGLTSLGLTALTPVVDPNPQAMLVLGTAAAWGGTLGAITPVALRLDDQPENVLFPAAAGTAVAMAGAGIAMLPQVGLKPRQTVVPQLAGLTGGTAGALVAALASNQGNDVALGALIGSVAGFVGGGIAEAAADRPEPTTPISPRIRVPGHWTPAMGSWVGADGQAVPMLTLQGAGL